MSLKLTPTEEDDTYSLHTTRDKPFNSYKGELARDELKDMIRDEPLDQAYFTRRRVDTSKLTENDEAFKAELSALGLSGLIDRIYNSIRLAAARMFINRYGDQ